MSETQQPETLLRQEDSASEATHCGRPPLSTLFLSFLRLGRRLPRWFCDRTSSPGTGLSQNPTIACAPNQFAAGDAPVARTNAPGK